MNDPKSSGSDDIAVLECKSHSGECKSHVDYDGDSDGDGQWPFGHVDLTEDPPLLLSEVNSDYMEYCKNKLFIASKADIGCGNYKVYKEKLEVMCGAYIGEGTTRSFLEGFAEGKKLGPGTIVFNDELSLHKGQLDLYNQTSCEYGKQTKFGHLILAGSLENFKMWVKSKACVNAKANVPKGRLFAYIEHKEEDEREGSGYIVAVNPEGEVTVKNGNGYIIFSNKTFYHGSLKNGKKHGKGIFEFEEGDVYKGQFVNDLRHGRGLRKYVDGDSYDGEWKYDHKHGKGVYKFANGKERVGEWKDDNLINWDKEEVGGCGMMWG